MFFVGYTRAEHIIINRDGSLWPVCCIKNFMGSLWYDYLHPVLLKDKRQLIYFLNTEMATFYDKLSTSSRESIINFNSPTIIIIIVSSRYIVVQFSSLK